MPALLSSTSATSLMLFLCLGLATSSCSTLRNLTGNEIDPSSVQSAPGLADAASPAESDSEGMSKTELVADPLPVPERPFSANTLLNLLVGELSVYEQDLDTAVALYSAEAAQSLDPGVVKRAAQLSRYIRDNNLALENAKRWYERSPDDGDAIENYALLLSQLNRPLEALDILKAQFLKNELGNFAVLRQSRFNDELANTLLGELEQLNAKPHGNQSLRFTYALLLQLADENEKALAQVDELKSMVSDSEQLAVLEARLLLQLDNAKSAASVLSKALDQKPDSKDLRAEYARILAEFDSAGAQREFAYLLKDYPRDVRLLMEHVLTATDNDDFDAASNSLNQLLRMHRQTDFAHYQLGRINQLQENSEEAVRHLKQVQLGNYFSAATELIIAIHRENQDNKAVSEHLSLLRQQFPQQAQSFWTMEARYHHGNEDLNSALVTLDRAIEAIPDASTLRLERSYLLEKTGDMQRAERDLRWVLEREPDNASALNALGYMLTINTTRYHDALVLIEKAIELEPEDAAIRDSLGWVYFKLGRLEDAQRELESAYADFPDEEVAAHLIELYWKTGQKKRARKLYREVTREKEQHPKVDAVVDALAID